jgi:hypothetical protein
VTIHIKFRAWDKLAKQFTYPNKKIMDKIKKLDLQRKEVRLERKKYEN